MPGVPETCAVTDSHPQIPCSLSGTLEAMEKVKLGYARVSTAEQNLDLQTAALEKAGCYEVYTDHGVTGRTMARPALEECLRALRPGDTLTVWKLDRLGRNVRGLSSLLEELEHRGTHSASWISPNLWRTPCGKSWTGNPSLSPLPPILHRNCLTGEPYAPVRP